MEEWSLDARIDVRNAERLCRSTEIEKGRGRNDLRIKKKAD